jgi:hypothetical protein
MQGFWTVQFNGVQGWGNGVLTLIDGHLFGGDVSFLYTGTYGQNGNELQAQVHVSRYAPGAQNVMGRDNFDLALTGTLQGNIVNAVGTIPGTPLRFSAVLTKRGELPAQA